MTEGGAPIDDPGAERHRILRQLRQQLERHPAIELARGRPDDAYAEITARIDPGYFGRNADSARLRVSWYPNPDVRDGSSGSSAVTPAAETARTNFDALFTVHYSEDGGYDCGFHNEPNPHVEGWFHFQERTSPDDEYDYAPASLDARNPTSALWELLDQLEAKLRHE